MKKLAAVLAAVAVGCLAFGLYCRWASEIRVRFVSASASPAAQSQDIFQNLRLSAQRGEAGVEVFTEKFPENAHDCFFLTLTFELTNFSPLPADWITLDVTPEGGDVAQVSGGPVDLGSFEKRNAQVTLLVKNGGSDGPRSLLAQYYALGRKTEVEFLAYGR